MNGACTRGVVAAAALLLLAACRHDVVDPCRSSPPPPVIVISVAPPTLQLAPGQRGTLTAAVTTGWVTECLHVPPTVEWLIRDTPVARVEADTGAMTTVLGVRAGTTAAIARLLEDTSYASAAVVTVSAGR